MLKKLSCLFILLLLFPIVASASGSVTVSTSNLNIALGGSATFTITANNAAGRVDITSSNPSVATVSTSSEYLDKDTKRITVTAHAEGSTAIKIYLTDVTTFDYEILTGRTYTINVNVHNYSNNNSLQSISVEGYDLIKEDNNRYSLTVDNKVSTINISAVASDAKSSITGDGLHDLAVGENDIEVVITAESGARNVVHVVVNRKEGYFLLDLPELLNSSDIDNPEIIIDSESEISEEIVELIKKSSKTAIFNSYDQDKRLIYSWVLDGNHIDNVKSISTKIEYSSEYSDQIKKASNYADGIYIHFEHDGDLPKGTMLKMYVGNHFNNESVVNLYYYNGETGQLELTQKHLKVVDGYIEYELEHCSDYFLTESTIDGFGGHSNNIFQYLALIELVIILAIVLVHILVLRQRNNGIINVE